MIDQNRIYCLPSKYAADIDFLNNPFYAYDSTEEFIWLPAETLNELATRAPDAIFDVIDSLEVLPVYFGDAQDLERLRGAISAEAITTYLDIWRWQSNFPLLGVAYLKDDHDLKPALQGIHTLFLNIEDRLNTWIVLCSDADIQYAISIYGGRPDFEKWINNIKRGE